MRNPHLDFNNNNFTGNLARRGNAIQQCFSLLKKQITCFARNCESVVILFDFNIISIQNDSI